MKSASLLLGEKSDDGTSERSQLEKKISNLHKQQTLILARLKETEREARSRPRPELPLQAAAVSPSETRTALKAADAGVPMAPHAAFVLVEPATAPRLASDWRASAERQGFMLALLGGALYLAIALWRFRPIHGLQALEALLPKEVIFVGGIPEAHK